MNQNWDLVKVYKDELDRYKFLNRLNLSKISILDYAIDFWSKRAIEAEKKLIDATLLEKGYPAILLLPNGELKTYYIT